MIKIFQLITSIQLGGAEIVAFNLSEYCKLKQLNCFEFVVVELYKTNNRYSNNKKKELVSKGINIISLCKGSKRLSLLIAPFRLAIYCNKEKPQIIHSHTDLPDFVLSNALRLLSLARIKIPKVVRTIHNTELWPTHPKIGKYTEKTFVNDSVVGVSDATLIAYKKLRLKNHLPESTNQITIFNGCTIPKRKDHQFNIDEKRINIAFCGRFELQKGIDVLIERIKEINYRFHDRFVFHLIGSGKYKDEIVKLCKISTNVFLYEAVPDIADKLYAFDFIIMPSRFEGLVLISLEASFSKVPVIAAFAPGLNETLPPDWPLQFNLESVEQLLLVIDKIINKKFDLEALKNHAYSFVSEKFSHSRMIDEYSKVYLALNV